MPKFAANLSTMFTERSFLERFEAAQAAGFKAVECQFPYEAEADEIKARLGQHGLELVLFNTPPGDFAAGERGLAGLPGREADFAAALDRTLAYAEKLDTRLIHVMAGVQPNDQRPERCLEVYRENLIKACDALKSASRFCLIEPINTRDIPGYLLNTPDEAAALIRELGRDELKLQFDFYHCQTMRGDLTAQFEKHQSLIPHVQIANLPGRHEPDRGEIAYDFIFEMLDRTGFEGWVGCEYVPEGRTEDGLGWAARHGIRPADTLLATGGERV
ncbi:MAG: 2-oxo-tetronate isomerase [Geminicoccaceae bacterium]|nr:2-oxo-tetronate isomerase [Geminicoccaceae bacterium]